jgi:hypothetical protein
MMVDATHPAERSHAGVVSGLLAAAGLFLGLIALAYHPVPLSVAALLLGLVSVAMSSRHQTLAGLALGAAAIGFVGGCAIAVLTGNPLW